jgi:hypothetical protein
MLETVEQVLRAFLQATKVISGRQYSTVGLAYFALSHLKEYLEEQKESDHSQLNHLKRLLLGQFKRYFEDDADQWDMLKVKTSLLCSPFTLRLKEGSPVFPNDSLCNGIR